MALDELLYGKIAKYFKEKRKKSDRHDHTAYLENIKTKAHILASALCEKNIDIHEAEKEGGYKNDTFFLPKYISLFPSIEENYNFYSFRIIYICIQKKMNLNWHDGIIHNNEESLLEARKSSEQVLERLYHEFPNAQNWHDTFLTNIGDSSTQANTNITNWLYGKWMTDEYIYQNDTLQHLPSIRKGKTEDIKTILKAKAIEYIRRISVDKKAQEDYVLTHNFEKVETADEFSGTWRDFDGDDDLKAHENALDELSLQLTVRVDDPVHSVYATDFQENMSIAESAVHSSQALALSYPEWDYKKRVYKENFCTLYPEKIEGDSPDFYHQMINDNKSTLIILKKILANIHNRLHTQKGRYDGEDIDLDAAIGYFTDLHIGTTPNEAIYIEKKKRQKDFSILILLDISLSSDGYIDGKKILDLEKEAAILLGEILDENHIDFSIAGFYSNTRNHAVFQTVKDFEESWNKSCKKIGTLQAQGYTRIGTALRHAASLLKNRPQSRRWLLLLTDGKPNDYDRYEGQYGIHDVQQALKELAQQDTQCHAYAIEATAKLYLPRMFGNNQYHIISSPQHLVKAFSQLLLKMKAI